MEDKITFSQVLSTPLSLRNFQNPMAQIQRQVSVGGFQASLAGCLNWRVRSRMSTNKDRLVLVHKKEIFSESQIEFKTSNGIYRIKERSPLFQISRRRDIRILVAQYTGEIVCGRELPSLLQKSDHRHKLVQSTKWLI